MSLADDERSSKRKASETDASHACPAVSETSDAGTVVEALRRDMERRSKQSHNINTSETRIRRRWADTAHSLTDSLTHSLAPVSHAQHANTTVHFDTARVCTQPSSGSARRLLRAFVLPAASRSVRWIRAAPYGYLQKLATLPDEVPQYVVFVTAFAADPTAQATFELAYFFVFFLVMEDKRLFGGVWLRNVLCLA